MQNKKNKIDEKKPNANKMPIFIYKDDHQKLISMCLKNQSYADKIKEIIGCVSNGK
ncbi:MAG: hypothetical protein Q7S33_03915 [Nanoarchaeota archaeon]|nr:hypothetical protein [Nanoarchaeota archaeon]